MTALAYILIVVALLVGVVVGRIISDKVAANRVGSAQDEANKIIIDAKRDADTAKKEALLEAKDEIYKSRQEMEKELKERRNEVARSERRILAREEALDKKSDNLDKKEETLETRENEVSVLQVKVNEIIEKQNDELQRIAGMTNDEARDYLLARVEDEVKCESAQLIRDIEGRAREEAEKTAREIVATAIQRVAADHVAETTVSVVALPNEEMKGRIIGREGRNIRTLETLTGIDLIIDDTPEAVILSGFDPVRREVARIALEKLISDGRIHPARIEEMVDKAKAEVDQAIRDAGEQATYETGVHGLHPELIKLLGRLKYRTSYGQNVLNHSIEVSNLAGVMAAELGADVAIAKRGGLLHDIGKAIDHEVEGTHVEIGVEAAKKYKESPAVIHTIMAHHGDVEVATLEAALVQAADAISAARPGARRDSLEAYIKRMEKLEEIANDFDGVEKAFAIQAGREVRIMLKPEKVSEEYAEVLAHDIVKRIESEMDYPGQIKIVLIRETRVTNYAK